MAYPPVTDQIDDDDDWLEPPTQGGASDPLVNQEFTRLSNKFSDAGYREGITDGKLSTLQKGFDQGFASSVPLSRRVGILRGKSAALLAITSSSSSKSSSPSASSTNLSSKPTHSTTDLGESLRDLIRELGQLRRDDILPEDKERIEHEKVEHPDDENKFELDQSDKRDLENLEKSLELMGDYANGNFGKEKEDGEVVIQRLEHKSEELAKAVLRR
ncbi:uncharacterized protein I206_101838 [Kwoniella pini CBS 10737]|uniref:Protein YAE1 n=1 Tax=Kwoniella pini CBS 10737 TaxID=1296096 RepID=A0A1B9HVJ9_9TREE|nr:uncharacterized protein I206_07072 [Kwoniella pini CBS 10737]OCF47293.1 hypothetical protein I206_07072 [Kwoniella pini CBS 10737]